MSATAFQRLRREAEKNQVTSTTSETDLSKLKNDELKVLLDEKGIKYDVKAKKEDLIKLFEGAE